MTMDEESIVEELVRLGWSRPTLDVWHRAKYRCEYCGCYLLASDGEYLYGSHVDHVVPGRGDGFENLALACKTCNFIKSGQNFADAEGQLKRLEIVSRASVVILARRRENGRRLGRVKELLDLIPAARPGVSTGPSNPALQTDEHLPRFSRSVVRR